MNHFIDTGCGCAGHTEDVDADSGDVSVQEFLHHHGHVPPDAFLCLHGCHPLWICQVWIQPWQVS